MMHLKLTNVGQIIEEDLTFGDLTVLVGSQATGKGIALQFLKLMVDAGHVQDELSRYGLDWSGRLPEFFDIYFGEGMHSIWRNGESAVTWNGKAIDIPKLVGRKRRNKDESLFFIPAQRVLTLRDGWPRPFTDYSPGDPFAVREYSEQLRTLVEKELGANENLFPQDRRLKKEFRELLEQSVFAKFRLQVDKSRVQKRLVLETSGGSLPYMVWSAGQREFVPLLLGLYWLMPPTKVLQLFQAPNTPPLQKLAETVMTKTFKVHYFDSVTGRTLRWLDFLIRPVVPFDRFPPLSYISSSPRCFRVEIGTSIQFSRVMVHGNHRLPFQNLPFIRSSSIWPLYSITFRILS